MVCKDVISYAMSYFLVVCVCVEIIWKRDFHKHWKSTGLEHTNHNYLLHT